MTTYVVNSSSELMENYLQADPISPTGKFEALCSTRGTALLFSLGEIGEHTTLYLTEETPAEQYGWKRVDLAGAVIAKDFPNGGRVTSFAASHAGAGGLRLAMVVNDGTSDHLYLSIGQSDIDVDWAQQLAWRPCPFNATGAADIAAPDIIDVLISEASDRPYIVVDVVRNRQSPAELVARYFIDINDQATPTWRRHQLPFDLEAASYLTCLGRPQPSGNAERRHPVDGHYTCGMIGGQPQFVYQPLFDPFDPTGAPAPRRLRLADTGLAPTAIAASRNPDNTTDLFAVNGDALYYFASSNQADGATAVPVLQNRCFNGADRLFASREGNIVTVWGHNASNEVFQLSCPIAQIPSADAWTVPLPIMRGVDRVSPYVNRANDARTIFARSGTAQLKMAIKSPGQLDTWQLRDIALPPVVATAAATSYTSYTTRIDVTGPDGRPTPGVTVSLATQGDAVTTAYINHLYYVLGPTPVDVPTDTSGTITIVEAVSRLDATRFTASVSGAEVDVNPMQDSPTVQEKLRGLGTGAGLQNAVIHYQNEAVNPPKKLVKDSANASEVDAVAANVDNLWRAHDALQSGLRAELADDIAPALLASNLAAYQGFVGDSTPVRVGAGDLFMMLDSAPRQAPLSVTNADGSVTTLQAVSGSWWETLVDWFVEAGRKVWRFVVRIGELIYEAVLDVVEKVYAAFKYVFDKIVEFIGDVIDFVKFLFDIDDMIRTKAVLKNLLQLFLYDQVEQIPAAKKLFDSVTEEAVKIIEDWAGLNDTKWIGAAEQAKPDPDKAILGKSAPETLLQHHFEGNASGSAIESSTPAPSTVLEALERAVMAERDKLGRAFDQLMKLVEEGASLSVGEILKRLVGIVGSFALSSAQVVIDALFDIIYVLAKAVIDLIDEPIHVPVVSDILNAFGIPDLSLLDILCWIAAVPITIGFKIAMKVTGRSDVSPFPAGPETTFLMTTKDFAAVLRAFGVSDQLRAATGKVERGHQIVNDAPQVLEVVSDAPQVLEAESVFDIPRNGQKAASITLHLASGIGGLLSGLFDSMEAVLPSATVPRPLTVATIGSAVLAGGSRALANVLAPRCPVKNEALSLYNFAVTVPFLLNKVIWPGYHYFNPEDPIDHRKYGGLIDAFLALVGMGGSIWHLVELADEPMSFDKTSAILDEISVLFACSARMEYAALVSGFIEDPEAKAAVDLAMVLSDAGFALFQFAEGTLEIISPWD